MAPNNSSFEEFIPWAIRPLARGLLRPNNKKSQAKKEPLLNPFVKFFSQISKRESSFQDVPEVEVPKKEFYKFSKFEDVSVEYLLLICKDFTPYELFSLAGTCKRLRNLLMSDDAAVQSIWRNSRLQHMRYLQLPPPYLLTEQEYIGLTMMERGCQFCGKRKNWVRVYWRFQVRSCYECYKGKFVRKSNNAQQNKNNTPETPVYLADLKNREADDKKQLRVTIAQRRQKLTDIMHELESETVEDDGCENIRLLLKYDSKLLWQCPSYKAEWRLYDQPFTKSDESQLKKLMENEYKVLVKKLYSDATHVLQ